MILFSLLILVDLSYEYALTNLFNRDIFEIPPLLFYILMAPLFAAEFGMTYNIFRLTRRLSGAAISKKAGGLFLFWLLLFSILTVSQLKPLFETRELGGFHQVHQLWILSIILIIYGSLIHLYLKSKYAETPSKKAGKTFALIYIMGFLGYTLSEIDFYFWHLRIYKYDYLILLMLNFCAYIWLKTVLPLWKSADSSADRSERLTSEYGISKRELEIIQLIAEGKSNKEIEEVLFISFNTVKNHIYNIYQKLQVNSRSQLIHLIHQL